MRKREINHMNKTIGSHDLITAENIMAYLRARIDELEVDALTVTAQRGLSGHYNEPIIRELHELLVHVEGDLDSMIKEMI